MRRGRHFFAVLLLWSQHTDLLQDQTRDTHTQLVNLSADLIQNHRVVVPVVEPDLSVDRVVVAAFQHHLCELVLNLGHYLTLNLLKHITRILNDHTLHFVDLLLKAHL